MSWRDMRRRRASADTSAVVVTRRLARRDAILSVQDKSGRLGYLHGTLSRYQKPLQSTEAVVTISTQSRVISIWGRLSETAHSLLEVDTTDRFRKITVQQSHQTPKPDLGGPHGAEKTTAHPHSHDTLYLSTASDEPAWSAAISRCAQRRHSSTSRPFGAIRGVPDTPKSIFIIYHVRRPWLDEVQLNLAHISRQLFPPRPQYM